MALDLKLRLANDSSLRSVVERLAKAGTVTWGGVILKSDIDSQVYVFGREDITDAPQFGRQLGSVIAHFALDQLDPPAGQNVCAIGIPTAGTALAAAASLSGSLISYRIMREAKKDYGAHRNWVNGTYNPESLYFTIDNVITDGASKLEAIGRLEEDGYPAKAMLHLSLIDRQQGGIQNLRDAGYRAEAIFNLLDLAWAFGELGLWNKERVHAVEDEIEAHWNRI
jgi:uridine monophosphate synthetase